MHSQHRTALPAAPTLEALEDRLVLSTMTDLSTSGSSGFINGALFRQDSPQPTGTGYIDSFVRLQAPGNATLEQGYNTDARPLQYNENNSPQFTRSLRLDQIPQVTVGGTTYYEFLLDINQKASSPLLSLDELRLYVGNAPNLTGYDPSSNTLAGLTPVYDLGPNWVKLNANLSHGSGSGDLLVDVPVTVFGTTAAANGGAPYVYLYSKFGQNIAANGGFEEWAVRSSTLSSLSGYVYYDANGTGTFSAGDTGLEGVAIMLTGTTTTGQAVNIQVTTDVNGYYAFDGLTAGNYTITKLESSVPTLYTDGMDNVGTLGGQTGYDVDAAGDDIFYNIYLQQGANGMFYNFGEVQSVSSVPLT